ncbi:uncharacterized protein RHIMIDRAFT_276177 [Rhizopus microsporus ATCC 52813]|uniref:Uncharacterized protein n=1 Tax=Rhizopus microsporus ATCC 52813 TaxID=1340429 RepID=A0A2G4T178_RHIZD|nr:uncharacterized protein RHIMIDRAFT_276177 [Rhizopus microsporus ATCC 52813]PHZ14773.1 hypothetical protein RHIMIDRAFT_276177 [Rhizopus microsporus ATCC 52813]
MLIYKPRIIIPFLSGQGQSIALRWNNSSSYEKGSDIRLDAVISTLMQCDFGFPVSLVRSILVIT